MVTKLKQIVSPLTSDAEHLVKISVLVSATGIGVFLVSLDQTIVNVSLPIIRSSFNVSQSEIQWVTIVYLLTLIAFSTPLGNVGDRFSNKIVFQLGMLLFVCGSLLCFFAKSLLWLIFSRVLQAIGGAAMTANGIAIIARFTNNNNRGTAIGINSFIIALGVITGPIAGGVITQYLGWPYIFIINVPLGLAGLFWVQLAIPPTPPLKQGTRKGDPIGSFTLAGFLTSFVFSITILTEPLLPNQTLFGALGLVISAILFVIFIIWEKRYHSAIIELSLFKNRRYSIGIFSALLAYVGLCVITFQLPFYLNDILHYSPTRIGTIVLVSALTMAISGIVFGHISNKVDAQILTTTALALMSLVLFGGVFIISARTSFFALDVIAFILGLSLGCFIAPNSNSVMAVVPKGKEGVSNALIALATNVGFAVGTAATTAIFMVNIKISIYFYGGGSTDPSNYVSAMKGLFFAFGVIMLIATILSYLRGPDISKKLQV